MRGPKNPFWYYVANPLVELQDGAVKQDMRAREVFGAEKDEWWKRADAAYSEFPNYRGRAGREIPLFVIQAVEATQKITAGLFRSFAVPKAAFFWSMAE